MGFGETGWGGSFSSDAVGSGEGCSVAGLGRAQEWTLAAFLRSNLWDLGGQLNAEMMKKVKHVAKCLA